ncbi:unnamed protein product, partial [Ectocarpus sp. 12 AP-2014]
EETHRSSTAFSSVFFRGSSRTGFFAAVVVIILTSAPACRCGFFCWTWRGSAGSSPSPPAGLGHATKLQDERSPRTSPPSRPRGREKTGALAGLYASDRAANG